LTGAGRMRASQARPGPTFYSVGPCERCLAVRQSLFKRGNARLGP
jgi:hypothetical protein